MAWRWETEVAAGAWLASRLHGFAIDVSSVVPAGFEAYARIFHPLDGAHRRWADLARSNGRIAHAEMQWHHIARPVGSPAADPYRVDARMGSLPAAELEALVAVLGTRTGRAERCWFAVWEGFGQLHGGGAVAVLTSDGSVVHPDGLVPPHVRASAPRIELPARAYHLASGVLSDVVALEAALGGQSPNLWWPDDRSWCVATEIDFTWTYVAGSRSLIDALLLSAELEVLEALPTHRITAAGDELNAALD